MATRQQVPKEVHVLFLLHCFHDHIYHDFANCFENEVVGLLGLGCKLGMLVVNHQVSVLVVPKAIYIYPAMKNNGFGGSTHSLTRTGFLNHTSIQS